MEKTDRELLILLLSRPATDDSASLANRLTAQWPSLGEILAAPVADIERVVGPAAARAVSLLRDVLLRITRGAIEDRPLLGSSDELCAYLRLIMGYRPVEEMRIFFLTAANRLVSDEIIASGATDKVPFSARDIIGRALELRSCAMIVAHNHPGGDPRPSVADIEATRALIRLADVFGILVHDHVVVTRGRCTSLRALGHI